MTDLGIIITLKVLNFNTYAVILPNYNSRNTFSTFPFFHSISWSQVLPISPIRSLNFKVYNYINQSKLATKYLVTYRHTETIIQPYWVIYWISNTLEKKYPNSKLQLHIQIILDNSKPQRWKSFWRGLIPGFFTQNSLLFYDVNFTRKTALGMKKTDKSGCYGFTKLGLIPLWLESSMFEYDVFSSVTNVLV